MIYVEHLNTFLKYLNCIIRNNILYITVKPTAVSILEKPSHISADKEVEVICQAVGGYPSPKLSWWLGSKIMRPIDEVSIF